MRQKVGDTNGQPTNRLRTLGLADLLDLRTGGVSAVVLFAEAAGSGATTSLMITGATPRNGVQRTQQRAKGKQGRVE